MAGEPWKSGEVVSRADMGKEAIWSRLQTLIPLPDHSQFQIISGRNEISHLPNCPIGLILLIPKKFPVTWRIEWPADPSGFSEVVQQDMTPMIDVQEAWRILHTQVSGLFEEGVINYRGKLRPGQVIQVEVLRKEVKLTVSFEVIGKETISFYDQIVSNMSPRNEIHAHFAKIDQRIPRFACYEPEELRPYVDQTCLKYRLRQDIPIPDTTWNEGGAAGGDTAEVRCYHPSSIPRHQLMYQRGTSRAVAKACQDQTAVQWIT